MIEMIIDAVAKLLSEPICSPSFETSPESFVISDDVLDLSLSRSFLRELTSEATESSLDEIGEIASST